MFAEVFKRVLSQIIMNKAGSKGVPGTNRICNLHAKAVMLNRLRNGEPGDSELTVAALLY